MNSKGEKELLLWEDNSKKILKRLKKIPLNGILKEENLKIKEIIYYGKQKENKRTSRITKQICL